MVCSPKTFICFPFTFLVHTGILHIDSGLTGFITNLGLKLGFPFLHVLSRRSGLHFHQKMANTKDLNSFKIDNSLHVLIYVAYFFTNIFNMPNHVLIIILL